jgi:hypothetical protein
MDSAYYEAQTGSPEHYAAYEKEFNAGGIDRFGDPVIDADPEASYEIDNAWELAWDRYAEAGPGEAARLAAAELDAVLEAEPELEAEPW